MSSADMPTAKPNSSRRLSRVLLGGAALAALAVLSAGCNSIATSDVNTADFDYRLRHPIVISEEPETFDMKVGMNGPALSPEIETAIRDYVGEYRADGTGSITIQVPTGSANEVAVASTGHAVHYALVRAGVPRGRIQIAPYEVGDRTELGALRLSYLRVKAVVPTCGIWPDSEPNSINNVQYQNFGCASQQNLAAMVADPADLIRPKPMAPINGGRRANVIQIYVDLGNTGWQPEPRTDLSPVTTGGS